MACIASVSFGKDSLAMLLKLIEEKRELDEVVFYDTGMEFKAIYKIRDEIIPILQRHGIKYTELKPEYDFEWKMFDKPVNGRKNGFHYGYSWCGGRCRWGTTDKLKAIEKHCKGHTEYVGIAADETKRLDRKRKGDKIFPLVEWNMTESDCLKYCKSKGFEWLEGNISLYDILDRVSCWCCANKNLKELKNIYEYLPEYWQKLKQLQERTDRPMKGQGKSVHELEKRFKMEIAPKKVKQRKEQNMELKIKDNTYEPILVENFDEIKALVQEKADHYANLVYTPDEVPQAKKDKATLNKFIKAIEDKRKEVKKACMQPYESFETQIKELVAICNEPVKEIDEFVKEIEARAKAEKREKIESLFAANNSYEWLKLDAIFNPKWLNSTVSLQVVDREMSDRMKAVDVDIKALSGLECGFEALEEYKRSLSLADAIREGERMASIQKKKAEQPGTAKQQIEYDVERREWISFKAYISLSEARELKAWLLSKRIEVHRA